MKWYAGKLGYADEEEYWGIVGLLHDVDFELYPEEHCLKAPELLNDRNLTIGDTRFTVNPQNYIYNALHNTKNTDEIKNLVTALYDYYKKAYAYFILT